MNLIYKFFKKGYITFGKVFQRSKWTIQFLILRLRSYAKEEINLCNIDVDKVIIIVPHADDELIGCFQFMKSNKTKVCLFYCDMTGSNNDETNKHIRRKEFERLCSESSFEYVISSENINYSLSKVVEEYDPNAILLPSIVDWHPQHREVNNIVRIVLCQIDKKPKIIWYQVTVPINFKWANYYVPMNRQQHNEKWNMFSIVYKSQRKMPLIRFKYNERIAGKKYDKYAAETFCVLEFDVWLCCLNKFFGLVKWQQLDWKFNINSLLRVRNEAALLYAQITTGGRDCQ